MGFGGSTPPPPQIVMPPPAAHAPVLGNATSVSAGANAGSAKKAAGSGFDGTIGTSTQGDPTSPNKAYTTLLGQ